MSPETAAIETPDPAALRASRVPPVVRLLRPSQWVKNAFVAAPLFFTPDHLSLESVLAVAAGMLCFCALSSAIYVLNDYVDRETDRLHPVKRNRPLAAGTVDPGTACAMMFVLAVMGLGGALFLSAGFSTVAGIYFIINLAYSAKLKHIAIIDMMCIASGFLLRVVAGAALANVQPSVWILVCTGLLAMFLAIAKRRDDLIRSLDDSHRRSLTGYTKPYLDTLMTTCLGALLVSYLIYTTDTAVIARIGSDQLYLTAPFVFAGVMRYLQITMVEEKSGAPTRIVLTDSFLRLACLGWLLSFGALIYLK